MKIMISQPMKGKTNEQIREQRAEFSVFHGEKVQI